MKRKKCISTKQKARNLLKHILPVVIGFQMLPSSQSFAEDLVNAHQETQSAWPYGTFHVFGDSHAGHSFTNYASWLEFSSQPPLNSSLSFADENSFYHFANRQIPFQVHWLGARTMHRIGRDGVDIQAFGVKSNDVILFCTGEIDCRVHIGRQVYLHNRALDEVISTLAGNYVKEVAREQSLCDIRCVICALPHPSIVSFHLTGGNCGENNPYLPSVPLAERIEYTRLVNQKLESLCVSHGILFVNPFDGFANPDGSLNHNFSDQGNHIRVEFNGIIKDRVLNSLLLNSTHL